MAMLNVQVSDHLLQDFRRFAVEKHGRIYRVLRPEVEAALFEYLEKYGRERGEHDGNI
jgi:hypothetical protein